MATKKTTKSSARKPKTPARKPAQRGTAAKARKTTANARKPKAAARKPQAKARKPQVAKSQIALANKLSGKVDIGDSAYLHQLMLTLTGLMNGFINSQEIDTTLNSTERQRLIGAGVRNYGFIEKAWDIARENPTLMPSQFDIARFNKNIQALDDFRQICWVLEKFLQAVNECMLIQADASFRDALRVYNGLRELTRGKVPGAEPLFLALLRFFRRRRTPEELEGEEKPTMKKLERDFMKMIHGKADGEIIIKNDQPHFIEGKREIIDDIRKGRASFKATDEGEITK